MNKPVPIINLSDLVADLQEKSVLREVQRRLQNGEDALKLVQECQEGVREVGERYEQGAYYISGLVMAGEIMRQIGELVFPLLKSQVSRRASATILIGTVQGDIHNIGKDIVNALLRCYGFKVIDIGVNVHPEQFRLKTEEFKPDIVGLSCLLHSCYEATKTTVGLLQSMRGSRGNQPAVIVGGLVNQEICDYVGADSWADDAIAGVRLCQQLVSKNKKRSLN